MFVKLNCKNAVAWYACDSIWKNHQAGSNEKSKTIVSLYRNEEKFHIIEMIQDSGWEIYILNESGQTIDTIK